MYTTLCAVITAKDRKTIKALKNLLEIFKELLRSYGNYILINKW